MLTNSELTEGGLFGGVGGFQLAAKLEGIKTKWISELNNYRQNILKQHFPYATIYGNIFKLRYPPKVDIITGGFPCQDLSISGPGIGIVGRRSRLWAEYFRLVCEVRPKYIVIENSPQLASKGLEIILHDLSQIGYDAQWQCVSAYDFGYPIIRERFICVAFPMQVGYEKPDVFFRSISEVFQQTEIPKQIDLPMSLIRINRHTNFGGLRISPGFSKGLDKNRIEAIGDAVNVTVAQYVFRCIKLYESKINQRRKTGPEESNNGDQ